MEANAEKKASVLEELYNELDHNLEQAHRVTNEILIKVCKIKDICDPKPDDRDASKQKEPSCFVDLMEQKVRSAIVLNQHLEIIANGLDQII